MSLTTAAGNCYGQSSCEKCGIGVTIADDQGATWTYCHGSTHHVLVGDRVDAGAQVLTSGNSGNSSGPHLHLSIHAGGAARCPQPLIGALLHSGTGTDPFALPTAGCHY